MFSFLKSHPEGRGGGGRAPGRVAASALLSQGSSGGRSAKFTKFCRKTFCCHHKSGYTGGECKHMFGTSREDAAESGERVHWSGDVQEKAKALVSTQIDCSKKGGEHAEQVEMGGGANHAPETSRTLCEEASGEGRQIIPRPCCWQTAQGQMPAAIILQHSMSSVQIFAVQHAMCGKHYTVQFKRRYTYSTRVAPLKLHM